MIKLSFCLHRLPQLTREAFQRYWFQTHAPLVARHREVLRISRYVQMHAATTELNEIIRAGRSGPEMYDGVAELWWESFDDLATATQSRRDRPQVSLSSRTSENSLILPARRCSSVRSGQLSDEPAQMSA
jgi:uncharacterized protein (TIGR02118 family)